MGRAEVDKIMGQMARTPGAAIVLLKRLRTLIRYAIALGWIDRDPTSGVQSYRSNEFHTWTEGEIAQFERHWPIGSRQRLGFALHLYTGQRGSDVHRMAWQDVRDDTIRVAQQKTGAKLTIILHPELQRILRATEKSGSTILLTNYREPFSSKGFANFMSDAIRAAGLPAQCKAHGLRKAAARRLAEAGCSEKQIAALTGHKTLAEIERYTRAADQEKLNRQAIGRQVADAKWQPGRRDSDKPDELPFDISILDELMALLGKSNPVFAVRGRSLRQSEAA
jgi:integrase